MYIDELTEVIREARPHYKEQRIKKKVGGYRKLHIPDEQTKKVQRAILRDIDAVLTFLPCVKGYKRGTSILDNARAHLGNDYLIHYDIANFFDHITEARVKLELKRQRFSNRFIQAVVKWCIYKNRLPQGAPSSPILSNVVCMSLDSRMMNLTKKIRAVYTRYADDIVISGAANILQYQNVYCRIIRTEHFTLNHHKTKITALHTDQVHSDALNFRHLQSHHIVTGLAVYANRITVRPDQLNRIRKELIRDTKSGIDQLSKHTIGKLAYIQHIDPKAIEWRK